jgi:hypothetical protein
MTRPTPFPRTHWVYVHISAEGVALYVGCTKDPEARWAAHMLGAEWADAVADVAVIGPFMRSTGLAIEKEFIEALQPPWNVFYTERDPRVRRNWPVAVPDPMPRQIRSSTGMTHYASRFGKSSASAWCGQYTAPLHAAFHAGTAATCVGCARTAALQARGVSA